ncbi:alpha/beta hydrolase [Flaviaesturariibacter flavus]|uniref:Alpha/beta hydrolase n=1 Tax=Flaviaesturariibacter flavus TaxID=2502780 RepID=A0A4R1B559_9BACT|nr:alpha/beta hydrolase-fold protein [Flaviaesturariibacter flavus]TCJ12620.1 alpha/beta hydrolase [Flaviaesturariibacter flavus]
MKYGFLVLSFFLSLLRCAGQLPGVSSGRIVRIDSFPSRYVDSRNIDVWLPQGYPSAGRYAVLYMHDGQMLFDSTITWNHQEWMADEAAARLQATGQAMPFIIVGIPNNGKWRRNEFFPEKAAALLPHPAIDSLKSEMNGPFLADRYLSFLVKELKPYIDRKFKTNPDAAHTFLAGSSMGGLISLYGLCEYPGVFGGAACLSTHWPGSLKRSSSPIPAAFRGYLAKKLPKPGTRLLYMDHGDKTLDSFYLSLQPAVDSLVAAKGYRPPFFTSHFFPGADHSERSWASRLEVPLLFLLRRR